MENLYNLEVEENVEERVENSMDNMYNIEVESPNEEIKVKEEVEDTTDMLIKSMEEDSVGTVEVDRALEYAPPKPREVYENESMSRPVKTKVGASRKTKDSFLNSILDMYQPKEMAEYSIHNERRSYVVGSIELDKNGVHEIISEGIRKNHDMVSFATDELKLHNRIIDLGAERDKEEYVLIQSDLSDLIVRKNVRRNSLNKDRVIAEIESMLSKGLQAKVDLLEEYNFTNENNLNFKRYRFRLALNEIKEIITHFKMQGYITEDSFLVLYE